MKFLCTYIVTSDGGLAPNPFGGYCTLAVCTPNHQNVRLSQGDWIAGFLGKKYDADGHKFLYAMEISEILDFDRYFHDPRFESKKPRVRGGNKELCGDNFYMRKKDETWFQRRNPFHKTLKQQDTKNPHVFIASKFWYRGALVKNDPPLPKTFLPLIKKGQGVKKKHDKALASGFIHWVENHFERSDLAPENIPSPLDWPKPPTQMKKNFFR